MLTVILYGIINFSNYYTIIGHFIILSYEYHFIFHSLFYYFMYNNNIIVNVILYIY